jgi:hypothetical protein
MKTVQFKLVDIQNNVKYRPEGYYEDVMSRGEVSGEYIVMGAEDAMELINKYLEKSPIDGLKTDTSIWGPVLWETLHNRAEQYEMDVEGELRWIGIFKSWIPCGECKNHFTEILHANPPDLSSKLSYREWAVAVHNTVNALLGKPIFVPSADNSGS